MKFGLVIPHKNVLNWMLIELLSMVINFLQIMKKNSNIFLVSEHIGSGYKSVWVWWENTEIRGDPIYLNNNQIWAKIDKVSQFEFGEFRQYPIFFRFILIDFTYQDQLTDTYEVNIKLFNWLNDVRIEFGSDEP